MSRTEPVLILGERPGPRTDPKLALFPHTTTGAAAKLISLLGWPQEYYLQHTTRINVFHDGYRMLDLQQARRRVERYMTLVLHRHSAPRVIVVGRETLRAMPQIYRSMEACEVRDVVMYLPHTSGVNRWYNSAQHTELARRTLREHVAAYGPQNAQQGPAAAGGTTATPPAVEDATAPSETFAGAAPAPA